MDFFIFQYGIGDLLFDAVMQRESLIDTINFNLIYFSDNRYYQYPKEELELRMRILSALKVRVNYITSNNMMLKVSWSDKIKHIDNFKLSIPTPNLGLGKYIVFHTKLRPAWEIKHRIEHIKNLFRVFCNEYKCSHKIILLGERNLKRDMEVDILGITTIYDELLGLKKNNIVIDMTDNYILPDYDNFLKSVAVISNAKYNVCFGHGGAFCMSIMFAKRCIAYIDDINYHNFFNLEKLSINNTHLYSSFEQFTDVLKSDTL